MRTALYFPHTEIRSENLIRTALLTWDSIEYIVPSAKYTPQYDNPKLARAMKIVGQARVSTDTEKEKVHDLVVDLLHQGVPETFKYSPDRTARAYEIWPQKFLEKTWKLLEDHGVTKGRLDNLDYPTNQAAGLSLMAILADVLAGESRTRVTDRSLAYATIANAPNMAKSAEVAAEVVPVICKVAALDQIPIEKLISFREREALSSGSDYRTLRHNYLAAIEKHIQQVSKLDPSSKDRTEVDRAFVSDMDDDLRDLKKELGFAKNDAWLTKDVLTLALAGGALIASAAAGHFQMPDVIAGTGGAVLIGGALNVKNKYAKSRYDILRKHPMAYLYELS